MAKLVLGKTDEEIDALISTPGGEHLTDSERILYNDPNVRSTKPEGVYDEHCYICRDPDYARMGMPLCYACPKCTLQNDGVPSGHVAADDTVCTVCGYDMYDDEEAELM